MTLTNAKRTKRKGAGQAARETKLAATAAGLPADRNVLLPLWVRAPVRGPEHFSGLTRSKLYQLDAEGHIRSVSLRDAGRIRGVRLFNLKSILDFIARCEAESITPKEEGIKGQGGKTE